MDVNQFFSQIKENLSFFQDKTFSLDVTQKKGNPLSFEFDNYNSFIEKIEKLGAAGAGFNFLAVQNSCCERSILKPGNFKYWVKNGDWSKVRAYATFVKWSDLKTV